MSWRFGAGTPSSAARPSAPGRHAVRRLARREPLRGRPAGTVKWTFAAATASGPRRRRRRLHHLLRLRRRLPLRPRPRRHAEVALRPAPASRRRHRARGEPLRRRRRPTIGPDGTIYSAPTASTPWADGTLRWKSPTRRRRPRRRSPPTARSTPAQDDGSTPRARPAEALGAPLATTDIAPAVGDDGTVYFGADDHKLYARLAVRGSCAGRC